MHLPQVKKHQQLSRNSNLRQTQQVKRHQRSRNQPRRRNQQKTRAVRQQRKHQQIQTPMLRKRLKSLLQVCRSNLKPYKSRLIDCIFQYCKVA
jgi:hypothetical protein